MLQNDANYEKYDPQVVTCGLAQQQFPAPTTAIMKKARKIFVQSSANNTGLVYVGKNGVKADDTTGAYQMGPGQVIVLPGHMYADWYHISDTAAQKVFISYVSGEY